MQSKWSEIELICICTNTVENWLGVHFKASNLQVQSSFQEVITVQFTFHPPGVSHYLYSFPRFFVAIGGALRAAEPREAA